jgi:hypothetical protein
MIASAGRSAEAQLLLSCARSRMDGASAAGARAALARGIQWEQLLRTAELQGVTPLLHANLGRLFPGQIPSPHVERLRQACRGVARLNLSLVAELRRLLQQFEERHIPAIPFKGPVLAASAYGNLTLRRFRDLDILVRERDGDAARRLLAELGYVLGYHARGQEYHFVDEGRHITVDLHQRIASSYFPVPAGFDVIWGRSRPVSLGGWMVRSLAPEDTAFGLCVHLAKDYCTWKERLSQLCDLAELMATEPTLPWDRVLDHARAAGGERIVLLALWLTRELLGSSLPDAAVARLAGDPEVFPVGTLVKERLLRQLDGSLDYIPYQGEAPVEDFSLYLAIRERRGDRIRLVRDFILNRVGRLVTPTESDHRFLPLPGGLSPLYYLIRPIRVARDRLRRVPRGPRRSSIRLRSLRRTQ